MFRWLFVIIFMLCGWSAWCAEPVTITDDGMVYFDPYKPDMRYGNRLFHVGGMGQHYGFSLFVNQKKNADGTWQTIGSSVGMPAPCEANWYHSAFFNINANGKSIQIGDPEVEIVETGRQGILSFTWEHEFVTARVRLLFEPGSDHVLMELRWEPKLGLHTLHAGFTCYPQGFRPTDLDAANGLKLERHMITARGNTRQEQIAHLILPDECWQLYTDATLEHSPFYHPGGPAGLLVVPDDISKGRVDVGSYSVDITTDLNPESGLARFALWDFSGKSDAAAQAELAKESPAILERMRSGSWLPTHLATFKLDEEQVALDKLAKALGSGGAARIKVIQAQLAALNTGITALPTTEHPFQAEHDVRATLSQYRLAVWQAERLTRKSVRTLLLSGPFRICLERKNHRRDGLEHR